MSSVPFAAACGTDKPKESFARGARSKPTAACDRSRPARDAGAEAGGVRASDAATPPDAAPADAASVDAGSDAARPTQTDRLSECGPAPLVEGNFSRQRLREASADCAIHTYCQFRSSADALQAAVESYLADSGEPQLMAARAAWRTAMDVWSKAELFQFGPAASAAESAGKDTFQGRGLRDRIYAWPATSRCRVEEQIVARASNVENLLISGRGLFALEYVLFYAGDDSGCVAGSQSAQAWDALDPEQRRQRKRDYARAIAADVHAQARALSDAWSPDAGDFRSKFVSASAYPDEQTALNVLGWALVYVEKEVKDWKLGSPAGYTLSSPVNLPESPYARVATPNLRANLVGFRALFQGCGETNQGLGFDDWLRAAGHAGLADELLVALDGAEAGVGALGPLHQASPQQLEAAYQALRKLTSLLKGDLFGAGSPLNLKLPSSIEGDTD